MMIAETLRKMLGERQPLFIGEDTASKAAVIIPLVQVEGEWRVLFEVRSHKMRNQPGDISFPGGKLEKSDESPLSAALRETGEELGIDPAEIEVIGRLSPYVVSPSFVLYPFVAVLDYGRIREYNRQEVEEIFTVPLKWLLEYEPYCHYVPVEPKPEPDFPFHKIMNGVRYRWRSRVLEEWFFEYEGYTIWGMTARVLKYFLDLARKADLGGA